MSRYLLRAFVFTTSDPTSLNVPCFSGRGKRAALHLRAQHRFHLRIILQHDAAAIHHALQR
ncbi:MAG: hypothetical protein AAGI03_17065, partial [Pseudomonadota bacterium]